ncbi:microtubule-associated protein futsch-like [Chironomus tepperi]|uniref:microtubule-associated protein futsch-like n=1 Tax=Chironomus tepperi TaxID=113505 RepID=UPI00391EFAC0
MAIENAQVLGLVARLVMDYLDEQDLTDAYNTFCETSRHLTDQEYEAYSKGIKRLDNGYGLINIVTEYFLIKDKLRDFIRACPKTSIIINLIDTANLQSRLDIILKVLKDNLLKFDQVQEEISRKRRKTENDLFNVSQTNTSTPETVQAIKKRRISCSKSNTLNNSNNNDNKTEEKVIVNKDLKTYISSPETSNKEDDVTEDESSIKSNTSNTKKAPPPELLSETILKKPDFAENLADIINKTLAEHEKSAEATSSQNLLTHHDVQDILSKTENDFEDILKEVIDKYLIDGSENSKVESPNASEGKGEELTIKQRLRPRALKKIPSTERKKKKINIISNEIYTGPVPLCVKMPTDTVISPIEQPTTSVMSIEQALNSHSSQNIVLVPIMQSIPTSTTTFIPLQSFHSNGNIICENNVPITTTADLPSNVQIILTENNPALPNIIQSNSNNTNYEQKEAEKVQKTPKSTATVQKNFLESKCKSTPRRKATHVRILDFNHTPSGRLAAIKECKTPSNSSIRHETPGSAPASIMATQRVKKEPIATQAVENGDKSIEIIDESSNSNSISNTPKVAKNRRRRKIEIDTKDKDKAQEEISPKPMTAEEWIKMREEQKHVSVDDRMRALFQQNEVKTNTKKRKTPKKRKEDRKKALKKVKPLITTVQQAKGKLCAKFKVTSPRKSALLRKKSPKKKKLTSANIVNTLLAESANENKTEAPIAEDPKTETKQQLSLPKLMANDSLVEDKTETEETDTSDLNRSDTVQEVANLLTHLPETILAKTNSGNSFEIVGQKTILMDASLLMETPLKLDSISPLPNTPRFAVPLITTHHETPVAKDIIAITTAPSILKVCDILTPSFPITPGFKVTPAKSEASPSTGYASRKTDYSSCSSYYKPDESEEININIESIIKQRIADRGSQSESDAPVIIVEQKERIRTGSVKKVECPGALERVLSFKEEQKAVVVPHYNMNEEGLLSESMITTASDESSSSFTCSTCSTDPSSDENTLDKLNKALNVEDRDSEWHYDEEEIELPSNKSIVDEKTGEVRFPLRNWITPKKIDPQEPKLIIEEMKVEKVLVTIPTDVKSIEEKKEEQRAQAKANMEAIKQRTINILKKESTSTKKELPKFKKANVKQFKLPAEQPKYVPLTRRDQILQASLLTERPKSTALKLIPSTSSSSSSRRKCLTPRKTIIMDELPKADPTVRKTSNKKRQSNENKKSDCVKIIKSPAKPEKVSVENINDNAMAHDDHPSLNISTSLNETSDDEPENTVVNAIQKTADEGSNTFQRTLIAQGFEKSEAKDLQMKFVDKIENEQQKEPDNVESVAEQPKDPPENINNNHKEEVKEKDILESQPELNLSVPDSESDTEDDECDDECDFAFADILEKNVFTFEEPADFVPKKEKTKIASLCAPSKLQIDGRTVKIDFCDPINLFTMEPTKKSNDEKNGKKEKPKEILKPSEPKILTKEISIDKILTMIHGNH